MHSRLQPATLTATAEVIHAYGVLTNDMNPLHIDPVFAAGTAMGGCIAHGTMSICLLWQSLYRTFGQAAPEHITLDIRFIKPVRVGETIHAGGQETEPGCYDVWVRGEDGVERLTGTAQLRPAC